MANPFLEIVPGSTKPADSNPFDAIVASDMQQEAASIRNAVSIGMDSTPDEHIKKLKLSRATGLPTAIVTARQPEVEKKTKLDAIDYVKMVRDNPNLARWLKSPDNATIAQDDITHLSALEQAANIASAPLKGLGGAFNDAGLAVNRGISVIPALLDKLSGNTEASDFFNSNFIAPLEHNKPAFALSTHAGIAEKTASSLGSLAGLMSQATLTSPIRGAEAATHIRSVFAELQHTIPQAARTFALPSITAAINTAFDVYHKTQNPIDAVKGFIGQLEASTANAVIPLSAPGKISTRLVGGALSGTAVGEGSRAALNAVLPNSMQQPFSPDELIVSAVTGGALGGVMGPRLAPPLNHIGRAVNDRVKSSIAAIEGKARIDAMAAAVSKAKLTEISPEDMRKFIQHVAPDETVSLSAEDAATFFQANPEAATALQENAPEVYAQLAIAEATGSDVKIPMEDYLTSLQEWTGFLNDHIKVGDGTMSYAEYEKSSDNLVADIHAEAQRAINDAGNDFNTSAQKVRATFTQSLTDTKRFTPDVVEKYSELMGSITSSLAARTGMTPEAFADKYQLLAQTPDRPAQQAQKRADEIDHAIYAIRSGNIPTDSQVRGQSLLEFLQEKGGLKDSGGELKARDANGERKPFQKNLVHAKGNSLDEAARLAHEAGFLPQRDINKLLDGIDSELLGNPVYADANFNQDMEDQSRTVGDVQQRLHDLGVEDISKMSNAEVRDALGADYNQSAKDFGISEAEAKRQYDAVVAKYKGTDQWMKAPNGEGTKLNERQWVQVRTPAFKAWFGNWDMDASEPVDIVKINSDQFDVTASGVRDAVRDNILKGKSERTFTNEHTGQNVMVRMSGIRAMLKNRNSSARKAMSALPEIIAKSKLTDFEAISQGKDKPHLHGYEIFKSAVSIDGALYNVTLKVDVPTREAGRTGQAYYLSLSDLQIEKADTQGVSPNRASQSINIGHLTDKVKQNASKVVDENGEPMVVYHNTSYQNINEFMPDARAFTTGEKTRHEINSFISKMRRDKTNNKPIGYAMFRYGIFFTPSTTMYNNYGKHQYGAFLNAKFPVTVDQGKRGIEPRGENPEIRRDALIYEGREGINEIAVLLPEQIKSATGNTGQFNSNNDNIMFQRPADFRQLDMAALPDSMNEVANHTSLAALKGKEGSERRAEYLAAKNDGDVEAALNVVDRVLKPAVIENIRKQLDPNKPVYVVPVLQREGESLNMLPTAFADELSAALGGTRVTSIVKTEGGKNTDKKQVDRLMDKHGYEGDIPDPDGQYIIVDDNFTSGNTVVPLIELIQSQGGVVPTFSTLAISRYGKSFKPKQEKLDELLQQTGLTKDEIGSIIGHDLENLTGAELQIILNATRQGDGAAKLRGIFASRGESGFQEDRSNPRSTRAQGSSSNSLNQSNRGSIQFPSTELTDGASLLTIMETADLSTVIHEMGHFYFETLNHIASQPDAPQQIIDDVNTLITHAGIDSLQTWNSMTTEERRAAHEQIAEEFEHYILEGKAPSTRLRKLFRTLKSWMVSVYRNSVPRLSNINDDVRSVFDRLIASEDEIAAARRELSADALFTTAEDAGMNDADYAQYLDDIKQTAQLADETLSKRSVADMKWLTGALNKELRAIQDDAKNKREAMQKEVTDDVYSQPVYAAWRYLTHGIIPEGTLIEGKTRLSTAALRDMYGKDDTALWRFIPIRTGKYSMVSKDGIHPDELAPIFGFDSGDALVRALVEAENPNNAIDAETNRRMLERYGDLVDESAQREAAMEALHNANSEKVIRAEYAALNKITGQRGNITRNALRDYAEATIGAMKVMDIRPNDHLRAERKAARATQDAFGKGDIQEAAKQKRIQMIQQALYSQAVKAKDEAEKAIRYLNTFNSPGVRKNIDRDYLDQIDALLETYDLRKSVSNKAIHKRQALSDWIEQQKERGLEPDFNEAILAKKQHYKTLSMDDFRGVRDAVKQIDHFGRMKHKLLTAKDKREFDIIIDEASKLIMENGKERPVQLEGRGVIQKFQENFRAGHRKLNSLFRQFDGGKDGGLIWELLGRTMNAASDKETGMIMTATERLTELYKPVLKLRGGLNGDKQYIPAIRASLTRAGRISVALNWGNETNRKRIMDGDHWTEEQVKAILKTLTPVEAKFVNDTWKFIDEFWAEVAAKEKRVTGLEPEKVMAEPFDMELADGSTVAMRGGYYPVKYDSDRDKKSAQHEDEDKAKDMLRGAATRATTRRGHTKQRVEYVGRPVKKSLDVITQHVSEVVHDLAWHEWLIDANRIMDSHRIDQAIRNYYGPSIVSTIKADIMAIAGGDLGTQDAVDTALLYLRANISRSTMGLSVTTSIMQPFGLFQSVVRIGPKYVLRGMARWVGDASKLENSMKWMSEKSVFMKQRRLTFNKELREINGRVSKGHSKARQIYDASLFMLMQKMQLVADVPTWIGAYEKALDEGNDDARAVALADQAVMDSQGGGETKDLSQFQVNHPMLMMFASYFNTTYNLMSESTAKTNFKDPLAVAGWISDMALLAVIPAIAPAILLELLKGGGSDDPEDWIKKLAQWEAGYLMGLMIGVRELSGAVQGFSYSGPPAGRLVTDASRLSTQIAQGDADKAAIEASIKILGSAIGIPSTQALRSYKGWKTWSEGDAPVTSILVGPPPRD